MVGMTAAELLSLADEMAIRGVVRFAIAGCEVEFSPAALAAKQAEEAKRLAEEARARAIAEAGDFEAWQAAEARKRAAREADEMFGSVGAD